MAEAYEALVAEIDRIVGSPYPTQLKQLHLIVCQRCTDGDVQRWAAARACQTDVLAQNLLEALQQWPYVLEIITKLCGAVSIRDALLRHEPTLLFETVSQAVSGSWKHNAASITMLSHPLPENVTLPAATQNLFLGIVDHAAQEPSGSSVRPVYMLLKGGLAPLLGLLSNEVLCQIERHFLDILRNTIGQEDQRLSLYCLSIMRTMITAANEDMSFSASGYETQELLTSLPSSPKWKPKTMQQFFTGSKAHKTLHLIVLRVLWAARISTEESVCELEDCLSLANELITFLPEDIRRDWCEQNPIVVRKFQEKVCQADLDVKVQVQALAFLCSLCSSQDLPDEVNARLAKVLAQPTNLSTSLMKTAAEPIICNLAVRLSAAQITEILMSWTSFVHRAEPSEAIACAESFTSHITAIAGRLEASESLSSGALAALSSSMVSTQLSELATSMQHGFEKPRDTKRGICQVGVLRRQNAAAHAMCKLYLQAALAADHSQTDVASDLYSVLLQVYTMSAARQETSCSHAIFHTRPRQAQAIANGSQSQNAGSDWREALNDHLQTKAQNEHAALSTVFANACADLERRCAEVEMPLKKEQEVREGLQSQYDELSRAYTDLEDKKQRLETSHQALVNEKADHLRDLESERVESSGLLERVSDLERTLTLANADATRQLTAIKADRDRAEMDHATQLTKSEERIEDMESKLAGVRGELQFERQCRADLERTLERARSSGDAHEAERKSWQTTEEDLTQTIANLSKARDELSAQYDALRGELQSLQQDLAGEKETHAHRLNEATTAAEERVLALTSEHTQNVHNLKEQHSSALNNLEDALAASRSEAQRAQDDHSTQLAKRDKKLADCVTKIETLKAVCVEKDEQIAEANAMRTNLMAAMGLGNVKGSQPLARRTTRSTTSKGDAFDDTDVSIPFLNVAVSAAKPTSLAQTRRNGAVDDHASPSPKRAKPRKSTTTMSPMRARTSTTSRLTRNSTQRRSAAKRQPLSAISGNHSPSKANSRTPCPKGLEVAQDDDTTFDGSEVFASTPGVGLGRGEVLPDDTAMME